VSEHIYLDFGLQKPLQGRILAGRDYRMNAGGGVLVLDLRLSFLRFIPTTVSYGIVVEK
jgi:hypothetical protein